MTTRLFDKKYYFTIYDFVGASDMFKDPDWDGDPHCPICGNWPCTCKKQPPHPPKPCPKCGQTLRLPARALPFMQQSALYLRNTENKSDRH